MSEFYCWACNKHKPVEQIGKVKKTGQKVCKSCTEEISARVKKMKAREKMQ